MNEHSNEAQLLMNEHSNEAQFDPNFNIVLTWLLVKIKQRIIYYQVRVINSPKKKKVRVINYYGVDFSLLKRNKILALISVFFFFFKRYNFFEEPHFYKTVANGHSRKFCLRDLSQKKREKRYHYQTSVHAIWYTPTLNFDYYDVLIINTRAGLQQCNFEHFN